MIDNIRSNLNANSYNTNFTSQMTDHDAEEIQQ